MSEALSIDHDLTLKMESQIDDLKRFKDSLHLGSLLTMAEFMLGTEHILVAILRYIDSIGVCIHISQKLPLFTMSIIVESQLGLEKHVIFLLIDEHYCYRSEHTQQCLLQEHFRLRLDRIPG